MKEGKLPVLFLIFNRKDNAIKALDSIKKYEPSDIYIAADGPRKHKINEQDICKDVRNSILNSIDWECNIHTRFREQNLGCANAVNDAITWFFQHEEYGIIIEDDIILSQDFYLLCEELLPLYKDEKKIMQISAQNRSLRFEESNTYTFNRMPIIWGWATWRRAWEKMDMQMKEWPSFSKNKIIKAYGLFQGCMMWYYWNRTYKHLRTNQSWATRWFFSVLSNDGICICPQVNLAINTGIGNENATHYRKGDKDPYEHLTIGKIKWPIKYTFDIQCDKRQLKDDRKDFFRIRMIGLKKKIKHFIKL